MQDEDRFDAATPPQDTGAPDPVEQDPAALGSAEDLDEDRLQKDPLEGGVEPPERWAAVDRWGTTPFEQSEGQPLDQRLAEEQPDTSSVPEAQPQRPDQELAERELAERELPHGLGSGRDEEAADEAGGSVADAISTPRPAD